MLNTCRVDRIHKLEVGGSRRLAQRVGDDHAAAGASDWLTRLDRGHEEAHSIEIGSTLRLSCLAIAAFIICGMLTMNAQSSAVAQRVQTIT